MSDSPLLTFVVPGRPANLGNARLHWAERAQLVAAERAAARIVGGAAMARRGVPRAKLRRHVRLTVVLAGHVGDLDGTWARAKPYLDGLVDCGLLVDDAPEWCEMEVRQSKTRFRDQQGVRVEVWDASPEAVPEAVGGARVAEG